MSERWQDTRERAKSEVRDERAEVRSAVSGKSGRIAAAQQAIPDAWTAADGQNCRSFPSLNM